MAKIILAVAWVIATGLWLLAMTRWKRKILERLPAHSSAWFWLRVFGIPETDANRARFIVYVSAVGIAVMTIMTLIILAFGVE